jgi:phage tail-like protein
MQRAQIERLLPEIIQRTAREGSPLTALLDAMDGLHAPSEEVLTNLDTYFDAYRAPERFVPFLARWVDLEWLLVTGLEDDGDVPTFPAGSGRLRELIVAAVQLSQWRGTAEGLRQFLETATGFSDFTLDEQVVDEDGQPRPFHLRVVGPTGAAAYRTLIERIIAMQKPAYTTAELEFRPPGTPQPVDEPAPRTTRPRKGGSRARRGRIS